MLVLLCISTVLCTTYIFMSKFCIDRFTHSKHPPRGIRSCRLAQCQARAVLKPTLLPKPETQRPKTVNPKIRDPETLRLETLKACRGFRTSAEGLKHLKDTTPGVPIRGTPTSLKTVGPEHEPDNGGCDPVVLVYS